MLDWERLIRLAAAARNAHESMLQTDSDKAAKMFGDIESDIFHDIFTMVDVAKKSQYED